MEYTFEQSKNQTQVVITIIVATIVMVGGMFASFAFFEPWSVPSVLTMIVLVGGTMAVLYFFVRKNLLVKYQILIGDEGFTLKDVNTGEELRYAWREVKKFKQGDYNVRGIQKEYLWMWAGDPTKQVHIECEPGKPELQDYLPFREACLAYLRHHVPDNERTGLLG